jgi:hypothetical protein
MRVPKCLRKKKSKTYDRRGKHTKADRANKAKRCTKIIMQNCRGCNSLLDQYTRTEEGDALVCTNCALVDDGICFEFETPMVSCGVHSNEYRHKNYFAERILQARDEEPRLTSKELDILSSIYDIYRLHCPTLWAEEYFTKKHAARICRLIVKYYPKSRFRRRLERWYQYRNYLCGRTGTELPLHVANALKVLFNVYSHFFSIYIKEMKLCRRNITQLDLVILVLLYNLGPKIIRAHGWYFLTYNILNKTQSTRLDMIRIKGVCRLINENILKAKPTNDIGQECYAWFRAGHRLKVPSLTTLINYSSTNPMAYAQILAYKGHDHLSHLSPLFEHGQVTTKL